MKIAPRRNHAHKDRPLFWPAVAGLLTAISIGEALVILELLRYIAIRP